MRNWALTRALKRKEYEWASRLHWVHCGVPGMFSGAEAFNQQLEAWVVNNVKHMHGMFNGATSFNQPLEKWSVSEVEDMGYMFYCATSFNRPLGTWAVGNVKDMNSMFRGATSFNQPLDTWDVSEVNDVGWMFNGAASFNQPLQRWDVRNVKDMNSMFRGAASFTVWRSTIGRNCRYFSFRASVSRLGFAPRVLRLLHLVASTSSNPCGCYHSIRVAVGIALYNCTQLHNTRIAASCLNCYILRMQHEAEVPSAETWWSTKWSEA